MGQYTQYMATQESQISPEDENYKEELLAVAKAFRNFDDALDEFIVKKGFVGDVNDVNAKVKYIKDKFHEEDIEIEARIIKNWFLKHVQANKRSIAFQFCFAFHLNLEETQNFFRRVYLQRGIDCHDMTEAIYYYCICHRMKFLEAQELIERAKPNGKKSLLDFKTEVLFTGSIIEELDRFENAEDLLDFMEKNREQFGYNNATAYRYIGQLWEKIDGPEGIANREAKLLFPMEKVTEKNRSVASIYHQIFGYKDYDANDKNTPLFDMQSDRTLQPILKNNDLIHPLACASFPDRQGLEGIIKGYNKSSEVVRKTMILLAFYSFWADICIKNNNLYSENNGDTERCLSFINKLLLDTGYPTLYEGNPYDWIFMFAMQDQYPLEAFRFFMRELYLYKIEESGLQ